MTADFRDTAHLVTGTLDTSGYGEGDLRDVALVYRTEPEQARTEARDTVNAEIPVAADVTAQMQPPLFDADGNPNPEAVADPVQDTPDPVQMPENPAQDPAQDTQTAPSEPPPVEQPARADKESKAPVGVKARRRSAAE